MTPADGTLLGGRVRYRQPAIGYRTGIEPVLLAASVTARPGERVLEAGTGAGAALLCLIARLPGVTCHGIEKDPGIAQMARDNLRDNGFDADVTTGDVTELGSASRYDGPEYDQAIANPPWHDAAATASANALRDGAKRGRPDLLADWARSLASCLRHGGSVTMVLPAAAAARGMAAMAGAGCGRPALLPFWPRTGQPARLVLLRAVKGVRGDCRIMSGLALHEGESFSAAARAILWGGTALPWV